MDIFKDQKYIDFQKYLQDKGYDHYLLLTPKAGTSDASVGAGSIPTCQALDNITQLSSNTSRRSSKDYSPFGKDFINSGN